MIAEAVSYTHLDVYKRQVYAYMRAYRVRVRERRLHVDRGKEMM